MCNYKYINTVVSWVVQTAIEMGFLYKEGQYSELRLFKIIDEDMLGFE